MQTSPKVSLIIPIHGEAPFLELTLESVQNIKYPNLEVILILDRPESKVSEICKEFSLRVQNCSLLLSPNPGISNALNFGILHSNGSFISRLDSDDLVHPERILRQVEAFHLNKNLVLIGTQMSIIDSDGHKVDRTKYPTKSKAIKRILSVRNCIGHPSVMFPRDVFDKTAGYRSELNGGEDLDLWTRMLEFGEAINLERELTFYRISDGQQTNKSKNYPGLMEEAVKVSNSRYGEAFLKRLQGASTYDEISELLDETLNEIDRKDPKFARNIKSIRKLWQFESNIKVRKLYSIKCIVIAILYSRSTFFIYCKYAIYVRSQKRVG